MHTTGTTTHTTTDTGAALLALSGAALISFSAFFAQACPHAPAVTAFYRMAIGAALLAALAKVAREAAPGRVAAYRVPVIAGIFFAGDLLFWHRSIMLVGPALATLLNNFQAVFVAILLPERSRAHVAAVGLALAGLFLLVGAPQAATPGWPLGIAFGAASAACYAGSIIALKRSAQRVELPLFTGMACLSAAGALAALVEVAAASEPLRIGGLDDFGLLLSYALLTQVFGWGIIGASIARLSAARAALILLAQPVLTYAWEVLFLGRSLSLQEVCGAAIALAGIVAANGVGRKRE